MWAGTRPVIVGLGNPGRRYARNRHNVGFMVLDLLAERLGLAFSVQPGQWAQASGDKAHLVKPLTYMNCSGEALAAWANAEGVIITGQPESPVVEPIPEVEADASSGSAVTGRIRPLVVCDDLALPLGSVRLRGRGSSGGQNGLASAIEHLGGAEFPRLRLGIAPEGGAVPASEWPDFVLADFEGGEAEAAAEMVEHAVSALEFWLTGGLEATISRYNRRVRPAE